MIKHGNIRTTLTLLSSPGQVLPESLQDYRGKKNVALAFFVFAFTAGWTPRNESSPAESHQAGGCRHPLGVSMDSPLSKFAFAQQNGINFPILGDGGGPVTNRYGLKKVGIQGVPVETARRATFLIDKSRKIISEQVDDAAVDPTKTVEACERQKLKNWGDQRSPWKTALVGQRD
jgi:peroxiredoxin